MIYLSIDVEASGPWPGTHSLASFGAAPVVREGQRWAVDRDRTFYAELKGIDGAEDVSEAMAVHGLTRAHLEAEGEAPGAAMGRFVAYLEGLGGPVKSAAWPASFDHPWVAYYLTRFGPSNPLGHSGFDIASFAMGLFGVTGRGALRRAMSRAGYQPPDNDNPHNGLSDAIEQAETLAWLLNRVETP